MTGVDTDLATLREVLTLAKHTPFGVPEFHLKSLCRLDFLCLHAPASLDRVEALLREQHAENARLREERDALRESGQRWAENVRGKEARIVAAEARCARLQQALTDIVKLGLPDQNLVVIAREALAGQPTAAEGPDTPAEEEA